MDQLLAQKKELEAKLKQERIKWNEYLIGEGVLAGHAHSLHEAQETKFKLLEKKIADLEKQLELDHREETVEVEINGQYRKLTLTTRITDGDDNYVSYDSPIGKTLQKLKIGETKQIRGPGGWIKISRLK